MEKILYEKDLEYCVSFSRFHLKQLQIYLEMNMDFVASDIEKTSEDSILFRNYNTCGYLLASIRDILKEFE